MSSFIWALQTKGEVCKTCQESKWKKNLSDTSFQAPCTPSTWHGVALSWALRKSLEDAWSFWGCTKLWAEGQWFSSRRGKQITCVSWSYFLPLMMIHRACIQFGLNHSKKVYFRSPNPYWVFLRLRLIKEVFSSEKIWLLTFLYQHQSQLLACRELFKPLKGNHYTIYYWMKGVSLRANYCWVISWKWLVLLAENFYVCFREEPSQTLNILMYSLWSKGFILNPEKK